MAAVYPSVRTGYRNYWKFMELSGSLWNWLESHGSWLEGCGNTLEGHEKS